MHNLIDYGDRFELIDWPRSWKNGNVGRIFNILEEFPSCVRLYAYEGLCRITESIHSSKKYLIRYLFLRRYRLFHSWLGDGLPNFVKLQKHRLGYFWYIDKKLHISLCIQLVQLDILVRNYILAYVCICYFSTFNFVLFIR